MLVMRLFDEACVEGSKSGEVHGELHVAVGQEAVAAGMLGALRDDDALVSTHRNHYHGIVKGVPLASMFAEIFERSTGLCRGFGGHMHLFDGGRHFSTTGIVGSSLPVALGHAYASFMENADRVAVGVTGDGGANTGVFYECLNIAGAWKLPLVVLVENNEYAISVPFAEVSATATIAERATAFGAWQRRVDGTDVEAVAEAFAEAVAHTRAGAGAAVLEATCYRFRGHYEGDLDLYRPEPEKERGRRERDPLTIARTRVIERGLSTEAELEAVSEEAKHTVEAALREASAGPSPSPADATRYVFCEAAPEELWMAGPLTVRNLNVSQYVAEAIALEMERDESIVVLGEDVGRLGGAFGATRGLQRRFGNGRVRDMPISEMAFTGMAVGLAMAGYRPLVEIMFVDFIGVCLEQIYNAIAKNHYMSGGRVRMPVVIKTAAGCIGDAAQHSQCLWGTLAHLPGLKVVVPSCPFDYKGLMAAALASDDPVVYIEHKGLLLRKSESFPHGADVPADRYTVPIGSAQVVRAGADLTLVTLGATVSHALEAAEIAARRRADVEVIDLRSIVPLDIATVASSVAKTSRLLVVDEDYLSFGLTGEVVARVMESLGPSAVVSVGRHALPDVPIPAARPLEEAVVPGTESILRAIEALR
jgi:2-oxoisovalerate dehydrogenase E1 component